MRSRLEWEHLALTGAITLVVLAMTLLMFGLAYGVHAQQGLMAMEFLSVMAGFWFGQKFLGCVKALREQWQEGKA